MTPAGVALVGYGYAGKTFHAPLIAAAQGLRLHTVVSRQGDAVKTGEAVVEAGKEVAEKAGEATDTAVDKTKELADQDAGAAGYVIRGGYFEVVAGLNERFHFIRIPS